MQYNEKLFHHALTFDFASQVLATTLSLEQKFELLHPWITNTALAMELYLKCLYYLENGKEAPRVHGLKGLYDLISRSNKKYIESFLRSILDRDKIAAISANSKIKLDNTAKETIENASEAFVRHRYFYERDSKLGIPPINNVTEVKISIRECILEIQPEWRKLIINGMN